MQTDSSSTGETGFRCLRCGSADFDTLVQYGSYLLRCQNCREHTAATSWIAIGPKLHSHVIVYLDGEVSGTPILQGIGSELTKQIGVLAADGTTLLLLGNDELR